MHLLFLSELVQVVMIEAKSSYYLAEVEPETSLKITTTL